MKDMDALRQRIMDLTEEIEDLSATEYDELSSELSTLQRAIETCSYDFIIYHL